MDLTKNKKPPSKPQKLAVLGGGLGSLSAVYELTDFPEWQQYYEITVYQTGWRLGGKTSSGRGIHNRIEERGIHIFQGWYDNAFRMIKDAYRLQEDLDLNPESPIKSWTDAFVPDNASLFTEWSEREDKWINWPLIFPMNDKEPGTSGKSSPSEIIRKILAIALQLVVGEPYEKNEGFLDKWLMSHLLDTDQKFGKSQISNKSKPAWWQRMISKVKNRYSHLTAPIGVKMLHMAMEIAEKKLPKNEKVKVDDQWINALEAIVHMFSGFTHWFERNFAHAIERHDRLRRTVAILDWMEACLTGVLKDVYNPETHEFDYENINKYNYRDWLKMHGASELALNCAPVRFMYTGSFANLLNGGMGQIAADIGLRMVMVSVDYKGSLVWKLTAGTGDTLITPIYQVLKHRGVKFNFFHKISEIHNSDSGEIERITVIEQVKLKEGMGEYDPFVKIDGLNSWPAQPIYDQLEPEQAEKLKQNNVDLESEWADWEGYQSFNLQKGEDFDQVLLGIPVAALKDICGDIINKNKRWQDMVDKVGTTQTVQVQIWTKPTLEEMGMITSDWGMKKGNEPNSVIYANYLYSWTDMSLIISAENWPESTKPGHLSYWCGTVPDAVPIQPYSEHWFPKAQEARLKGITEQWLNDNAGWLWPAATLPELPAGFNFDLMTNPFPERDLTPYEKFNAQYFVINIDPTNRYTLALPGTNKYRMKADESDFSNLFLTGDWTDFGFNVGHMEGTVCSGLKAAHAIQKTYGLKPNKKIL